MLRLHLKRGDDLVICDENCKPIARVVIDEIHKNYIRVSAGSDKKKNPIFLGKTFFKGKG